jgi:hypothetical protein
MDSPFEERNVTGGIRGVASPDDILAIATVAVAWAHIVPWAGSAVHICAAFALIAVMAQCTASRLDVLPNLARVPHKER